MLSDIQSRAARVMAKNRSEHSYFAGGAVLNKDTSRQSDDLDIFMDNDEIIPDIVQRDIKALRLAGFKVTIDLEIYGCTDASVRDGDQVTQVQWMSESRMRFFPLVPDPDWGLRLHMSDLAVNKVLAASTRRKARDVLDLALIAENYCTLGPLFLAGSEKIGSFSPAALLDSARQRVVSGDRFDLETLRGIPPGWDGAEIKTRALAALDRAEDLLKDVPDKMIGGLPVDASGTPVDQVEKVSCVRQLLDGGGLFPDFPEATIY